MLQVREGATAGDELTRGLPGEPLTGGDKALLELKPLKAFLPGEVCTICNLRYGELYDLQYGVLWLRYGACMIYDTGYL